MALALYRLATGALTPAAGLVLRRRVRRGKEDPTRLGERWGRTVLPRPKGSLVWLHGASVGESLALLPIVERLLAHDPGLQMLVTSGTVTSARLLIQRLPPGRTRHQYVPLDAKGAVDRFLDHWRPDLAVWIESELWPNLIVETRRRSIPMALLNARMSTGSWRRWRLLPGLAREILGAFDLVLAQDDHQAERLRGLGAAGAATVGDLKAASTLPEADPVERARLRHALGTRPVWLAASTHPGEETLVIEAHRALAPSFPDLLTVLAPRHPARADAVAAEIHGAGLTLARRSLAEVPEPTTAIFLVDTLGELSLFYRLAPITLIGGSLAAPGTVGGHNPFEPAQAGAALIHGPDMTNCAAAAAALDKAGAVIAVADGRSLIEALRQLLGEPERVHRMGVAARSIAEAEAGVADRVMDRLLPLLDGVCDAGA